MRLDNLRNAVDPDLLRRCAERERMGRPKNHVGVVVDLDRTDAVVKSGDTGGSGGDGGKGEVRGKVEVMRLLSLEKEVTAVGHRVVTFVNNGDVVLRKNLAGVGRTAPRFALVGAAAEEDDECESP